MGQYSIQQREGGAVDSLTLSAEVWTWVQGCVLFFPHEGPTSAANRRRLPHLVSRVSQHENVLPVAQLGDVTRANSVSAYVSQRDTRALRAPLAVALTTKLANLPLRTPLANVALATKLANVTLATKFGTG